MSEYSKYENEIVTEVANLRGISNSQSLDLCGTIYGFLMTEGHTSGKSASDVANTINTFNKA